MLQQVVTNTLKTNDKIESLSKEIGNIKKNLMVIFRTKINNTRTTIKILLD